LASSTVAAQQNPAIRTEEAANTVPRLINYSGVVRDLNAKPLSGVIGVTFLLYKDEQGVAPVWMENQNVTADKNGRYTVSLGSTSAEGLPVDLFANGEARWLGVQAQGEPEQPRVMLVSVPYALKAGDAQTLGGLPVSAFALAGTQSSQGSSPGGTTFFPPSAVNTVSITGTGTTDFLPLWTSSTNLGNSIMFEDTTHSRIGINTETPGATLDVKGGTNIEGLLTFPATGMATSSAGKNSQAQDFVASSYNSGTKAAVNQTFQWQAEPTENNTSSPSGKLNLLFASGTATPAETGLSISKKGIITFATGQSFPGAGTITGITAGKDLSGGGSSGNVTLSLDTTKIPQLTGNNTFTGNQTFFGAAGGFLNSGAGAQYAGQNNVAQGIGLLGGATASAGVGVEGIGSGAGAIGIEGFTQSTSGVAGLFMVNSSTGKILQGQQNGVMKFSVDGNGNLSADSVTTGGSIVANGIVEAGGAALIGLTQVKGNAAFANIGDPGCGPGYAGVGFALFSGCTNYSMVGDGTNTFINRPAGGTLYFRENNGTQMTIAPGGNVNVVGGLSAATVAGINTAGRTGMYASSPNGYGIVTDSNVQQSRTVGGWVKAMVHVDFNFSGDLVILNCFNGQALGAASTTPPCGFALSADSSFSSAGFHIVDFGFEVIDRFPMLTVTESGAISGRGDLAGGVYWTSTHCCTANQVGIRTYYTAPALDLHPTDTGFYLFIF
jgi:hypothetical protein